MQHKILLGYLFIILLSLSCNRNTKERSLEEISNNRLIKEYVFGKFCGNCRGVCAPMYKLILSSKDTLMYSDYSNGYFVDNLNFSNEVKSNYTQQDIDSILNSIPNILYENKEKMYGYPDYADGCGIYIEFTTVENNIYKFKIDLRESKDIPDEVSDYVYKVNTLVNKIFDNDSSRRASKRLPIRPITPY